MHRGIFITEGDPTVDERAGRVLVVGQQGVSMLDAATGALVRTVHLGEYPRASLVDPATRRVFISNIKRDVIHVLDLTTGAVVDTVPVGHSPYGMALDERTRRLFVLAWYSKSVAMLDVGPAHSAAAQPSPSRPSRT